MIKTIPTGISDTDLKPTVRTAAANKYFKLYIHLNLLLFHSSWFTAVIHEPGAISSSEWHLLSRKRII